MTANSLGYQFGLIVSRELARLSDEIRDLPGDEALWVTRGGQLNPPGTLAIHLVGNLMHFVGAHLGGTGYVRDRPAEFDERKLSRDEVLARIFSCRDTVVPILEGLSDAQLAAPYPGDAPVSMRGVTTQEYLVHIVWHLGWHLGQLYYHRLGEL